MSKNKEKIKRQWHLIDAQDQILGRLASRISLILQGKHKAGFLPYLDQGDWIVVINAQGIKVTGRKREKKIYYHYSGYPGGIKARTFQEIFEKDPTWVLKKAVTGMLPRNKLRTPRLKRLKIFAGSTHPYKDKFK